MALRVATQGWTCGTVTTRFETSGWHSKLTSARVTDAGLEHLKGLTQLQTLDLDGTKSPTPGWSTSKG